MIKIRSLLAVLALAGTLGATAAEAQTYGPERGAGNDIVTLNVYGGGFSPSSNLAPGVDFRNSGTGGAAATLWVHRNVGVRANVLYARTNTSPGVPDALSGERPDIWAYGGDLVLRMPLPASNGRDTWAPYVVGGLGGKTYDFDALGTETDFAGNFGAGIEYRIGRWGLQAEVRDLISNFERVGVDKTQHDIVWTGGVTLSF